ncbi:transglutaminase family protein [Dactylosporangium vinaceum]|uniref:Transglutaminase family protein n=1 Tax=Dactylosporangium vinaceum TaxID=53362 RepID=A0ABV5MAA8_9ACTN|nr:transglutaminase-like domain-containing protein [Dactylosporangium vinaceum]
MTEVIAGCSLAFDVEPALPTEIVLQIAAARRPGVQLTDALTVHLDGEPVPVETVESGDGGRLHVLRPGPGRLDIGYEVRARLSAEPAAVTPLERITFLRPSRYCPSDRLHGFAVAQFDAQSPSVVDDVRGFVARHTQYTLGSSSGITDAADTLLSGNGVCRDFAHLVVALLRALDIPARTAAVYAPGLSPMDFHAVAEVAVDGVWRVVDATGLAPRPSLLRIATGADAATTAFATVQSGLAELSSMEVRAIVDGDLPYDDLGTAVTLP